MKKHFDELSVCYDKFGDKINIPVSVVAILLWHLLVSSEFVVQVREIERGGLTSVVTVPIKDKNLIASDCKKSR